MTFRSNKNKNWVGTKNGAGVWQRIISEFPAGIKTYFEPFAGKGSIGLRCKPFPRTIFIDADASAPIFDIISPLPSITPDVSILQAMRDPIAIVGDAVQWTAALKPAMNDHWLLYVDPPYLEQVRSCKRDYYKKEFKTVEQHTQLLSLLLTLPTRIIISGYECSLYNEMLKGWRKVSVPTVKRSGERVTEILWINFPESIAFHDVRYLGKNFRERERIKRKKIRWVNRLNNMSRLDKAVLIDALGDVINHSTAPRAGQQQKR
jgi:DNA adenine methylase